MATKRASIPIEEDQVSILSQSQYQAYRPAHLKPNAPSITLDRPRSWVDFPISLQHSQVGSPEQPASEALPSPQLHMDASLFGARVVSTPYEESVPWANSTNFKSTIQEPSKPIVYHTTFAIPQQEATPQTTRRYFRHPRHISEAWMTGFWLRFPWWSAAAILLILILTGASAGILLAGHGTSLKDWKIGSDNAQPYVYISVFEMVMNVLLLYALGKGLVIRFWHQLLHGTTLSAIHDTYESAQLWPALGAICRFRFNAVSFACILTALSFIRGPLFQRALTLDEAKGTYHTSPLLVTIGIVLSLVGIAAILPLYAGFWELGRKVTLNPLEIARAFGAPALDGLDGNATPDMIDMERGGMGVRYGVLERFGEGKQLRVEDTTGSTVRTPWRGEIFG